RMDRRRRMPERLRVQLVEVERHRVHRRGGEELRLAVGDGPDPVVAVDVAHLEVLVIAASLHEPAGPGGHEVLLTHGARGRSPVGFRQVSHRVVTGMLAELWTGSRGLLRSGRGLARTGRPRPTAKIHPS